jgi:hypothetical protein
MNTKLDDALALLALQLVDLEALHKVVTEYELEVRYYDPAATPCRAAPPSAGVVVEQQIASAIARAGAAWRGQVQSAVLEGYAPLTVPENPFHPESQAHRSYLRAKMMLGLVDRLTART